MRKHDIINYQVLWDRMKDYALKVGRITARPVLLLYYVMRSSDAPWKDKAAIFGALALFEACMNSKTKNCA